MRTNTQNRPLYKIANEILKDWPNGQSNYHAMPYIKAMAQLSSIHDDFHNDSARSIVLYFLSNARAWRGENARRIKLELQEMLK